MITAEGGTHIQITEYAKKKGNFGRVRGNKEQRRNICWERLRAPKALYGSLRG